MANKTLWVTKADGGKTVGYFFSVDSIAPFRLFACLFNTFGESHISHAPSPFGP